MSVETALVDFFVKVRDAATEALDQLAPSEVKESEETAVSESNFDLNFAEYTTQKLGTFEVAEEKGNIPEKWNRAYNILKQANATIANRYHGPHYIFGYWLYNSKIYRQKMKK